MVADDPESFADLDGHSYDYQIAPTGGSFNPSALGDADAGDLANAELGFDFPDSSPPPPQQTRQGAQSAQNQKGTVSILGQKVPYTIAQGAPATTSATLNEIVSTINQAQDN